MNRLKSFLKILSLYFFLSILPTNAFAATLGVPGTYATIQAAIDAASSGDTVLVSAGTYVENLTLDIRNAGITLKSESGADSTIIDGNINGSVIAINGARNTTVDGFTITNGSGIGFGSTTRGGGIFINNNNVTIQNCIIYNNEVTAFGGGIYVYNGNSITISNCAIYSNAATLSGGGIGIESDTVTISRCRIYNNSATGDENGNGGGGIWAKDASPMITNCIIYGNEVTAHDGVGAGIGLVSTATASPVITNCTITRNKGVGDRGAGIGLGRCDPIITNTIIANNTKYGLYENHDHSFPVITNCDFYGNGNLYHDTTEGELTTIAEVDALSGCSSNIDTNPLFIDSGSGNFHLSFDSLCIDAGILQDQQDLKESEPNGNKVNIGAYGNTPRATTSIGFQPSLDGQLIDLSALPLRLVKMGDVFKIEALSFNAVAADKTQHVNVEIENLPAWLGYHINRGNPTQVIFYMRRRKKPAQQDDFLPFGEPEVECDKTVTITAYTAAISEESLSMKITLKNTFRPGLRIMDSFIDMHGHGN